ncbi:MAG: glucose 1-dehydrogenase [Gammaproteobacteria bacterium]|nr:glucose 1-dehydrogenase [Gammaproteobacteria bacterium]
MFSVAGQVVLISGASRGIGAAIAGRFAEHGAQVIVTGREERTITERAARLSTDTVTVAPIVCDVADGAAISNCVAEVLERFGRIDTLINVAGVNRRNAAAVFSEEDYDFIQDINLKGTFMMSQAVGRHMLERRQGSQINIDSFVSHGPLRGGVPYAMSKSGMSAMTRGLALEWGARGVRVNGIAPGFVVTDINRKVWDDPGVRDWALRQTPLGRLGEPDDMTGTAIFLASSASAYLTGQTLRVDGGASAGYAWPIELAES